MIKVIVDSRSTDELERKIKHFARQFPQSADKVEHEFIQRMREAFKSKPYPPKRAGQRYVRTGRLANSWSGQRKGLGQYSLVNSASYSQWVVGLRQARVHQGRWWIALDELREEVKNFLTDFPDTIEKTWYGR